MSLVKEVTDHLSQVVNMILWTLLCWKPVQVAMLCVLVVLTVLKLCLAFVPCANMCCK